jgi:hypothetical protein
VEPLLVWSGGGHAAKVPAPPPLDARTGVDAVVVSTDNGLT